MSVRFRSVMVAVAASLTFVTANARAQDDVTPPSSDAPPPAPAQAAAPDERIPEVRVVGSHADALQRIPGSGTVIGTKDIERAQPVDTAEMLRRVPGVQVRQEYSGGSRLDISVRGLESGRSRRVLLLEDGIPISLNPYAEPDMYYAPPIERYRAIEVVKGSGNILFGPQTLAGTINFVTLAPPERQSVSVDVDTGNYGYVRALARYGDSVGDVRYVVQLLERRGDGFREQPFDSQDGLAKIVFPTGKNGEASVKLGFHRDSAASDDVGLTSAMYARDPRRPTLAPDDKLILNRYDASLTHEQRFSSDTKVKTLLYGYVTDRAWRRQDYTRVPSAADSYARIVGLDDVDASGAPRAAIWFKNTNTILDRDYSVLGLEPRLEHRMRTGDVAHTIDLGGRVLRETADYQQRSGTNPETFSGSLDFAEKHDGTVFAAYLQDRIAFREDLLVTPGIRFEQMRLSRTLLRQDTGNGVQDVSIEGHKTVFGVVPGIGMTYGTKVANVFGGVHVGFAPPRITSAISALGKPSDVSAEKSIDYEFGGRARVSKWWRLEATGFLSNFDNQVIINTAPGAEASLTDAGATNLYGVETATVLGLDKVLSLGALVELGVRYTYSHASFRHGPDAGNLLPYAPQHSFNTNLDIEHPSGIGGQIAYAFIGRQYSDADNTEAEDPTGRIGAIGARSIVDATIHYRHAPSGLTFRLTAKNLLDATYVSARRPEGIFPGAYRQLLVGIRWDWERKP